MPARSSFLSQMLGVRRASVNAVAGLEATACECYQVIRKEYERLLGSFP